MELKDDDHMHAGLTICHTADIHIRGRLRHDEYRRALNEFIEKCALENPDIIIVAGDIWHTKTHGITPESIDIIKWFFKGLATITKTYVILGNHDENRLNKSQLDAITPILSAIDDTNLVICKNSGTYRVADGFNVCVLTDESEASLLRAAPSTDDVNIAVYHGPISGALSDEGWKMDGISAAGLLNRYDFLLLGDIHKRQFMDVEKRSAYPGSLIPQNYSETEEKGFLVWKIGVDKIHSVEFKPLQSYSPFITIEWPGSFELFEVACASLKKDGHYRIRFKENELVPRRDITRFLEENFSAVEVIFKKNDKAIIYDSDHLSLQKQNEIKDETILESIKLRVKQFIELRKLELNTDQILDLVSTYFVQNPCDRKQANIWSISSLKFDNTFSYGENNSINFSKMSGVIGIFAPNKAGKSSIIGTLLYALQNTTDRGSLRACDVINVKQDNCAASVCFVSGGKTYHIERRSERHQVKKRSTTTSVNFYENSSDENLNDLQRNDTDKEIRSLIGTAQDVLLTSISTQFDINAFVDGGVAHRKSIIARHFGLDHYETLYAIAKKDAERFKLSAVEFESTPWANLISVEQAAIDHSETQIAELRVKITETNENLGSCRMKMGSGTARNYVKQEKIDETKMTLFRKVQERKALTEELDAIDKEITRLHSTAEKMDAHAKEADVQALREKLDTERRTTARLTTARHNHDKLLTELKHLKQATSLLKSVPCGDKFPTCPFICESIEKIPQVKKKEEEVTSSTTVITDISREFNADIMSNTLNTLKIAEDAIDEANKAFKQVHETSIARALKADELAVAKRAEDVLRLKLSDMLAHRLDSEKLKMIDDLEKKITVLTDELSILENALIEALATSRSSSTNKRRLEAEMASKRSSFDEWKARSVLIEAFSKHGIPEMLVSEKLPVVNAELASIIGGLYGFSMALTYDEKSGDIDIVVESDGSERRIELCCGMEKVISSLAIRAALAHVSSLPRSDVFIIDEGFGSLDEHNLEQCRVLLRSLADRFRAIVIITHVEQLKDFVDSVIEIGKDEQSGKSFVRA